RHLERLLGPRAEEIEYRKQSPKRVIGPVNWRVAFRSTGPLRILPGRRSGWFRCCVRAFYGLGGLTKLGGGTTPNRFSNGMPVYDDAAPSWKMYAFRLGIGPGAPYPPNSADCTPANCSGVSPSPPVTVLSTSFDSSVV